MSNKKAKTRKEYKKSDDKYLMLVSSATVDFNTNNGRKEHSTFGNEKC
jgi:hypothetical protein